MTSQLPRFWCFFAADSWEKDTQNGAAVTSLRSFLFCDYFSNLMHKERNWLIANLQATSSSVELLLDDEPRLQPQTHHGGLGASSHSRLASAEADSERSNGVMIQYDDDLVAAHHAASEAAGGAAGGGGDVGSTGVTRFDLADNEDSLQSSMVDLDLNLLPLDAKILPQEAIRNQGHYHHLPRRAGPRHRSGYNTDTIRSNHSAKSVTIANQVTEFHYSGEPFWNPYFLKCICF